MKRAIVTGISGQDGSYLAELLLSLGYEVHGIVRRNSPATHRLIDHLLAAPELDRRRLYLHSIDLQNVPALTDLFASVLPDEVYHLAGQSHVGLSFGDPVATCEFTAMGTLRMLEVARSCKSAPRLLHTSSSEIFGAPSQVPQDEATPHNPVSPYGVAKSFATNMVRIYRESFEQFTCNAICFNHESPRRRRTFVTRKITQAAARIKLGLESKLALGNVDAQRDWGYAPDYVRGFHALLQQDEPTDCVFATGRLHRVRDWLEIAFGYLDLDWEDYVVFDPQFTRKADPALLVGSTERARVRLDWSPSVSFESMVVQMVEHDLQIQRVRRAS
ncbi:MAG: GDP-mannose 4,6-dehydratase [Planctomycetota bacterium]|nr:MAG: GDP-mannose 4,6-dehydratase [Planctomycetota bacterium]